MGIIRGKIHETRAKEGSVAVFLEAIVRGVAATGGASPIPYNYCLDGRRGANLQRYSLPRDN
jgi:hypothetical protein